MVVNKQMFKPHFSNNCKFSQAIKEHFEEKVDSKQQFMPNLENRL